LSHGRDVGRDSGPCGVDAPACFQPAREYPRLVSAAQPFAGGHHPIGVDVVPAMNGRVAYLAQGMEDIGDLFQDDPVVNRR
jgi:hypothetical protein